MDELRSTLFLAGLRRLLAETLQPGERVLWQGQPDGVAHTMMWRFLWWVGFPWLLLTGFAVSHGWLGSGDSAPSADWTDAGGGAAGDVALRPADAICDH
jgi:hypothetical protein